MSIKKPQLEREPAGCFAGGGSGAGSAARSAGAFTGPSSLGERQLAGLGIVIENVGVAASLDGGIELAAGLLRTEVLVKQVAENFFAERAIGFGAQSLFHLTAQRHVGKCGFG